MAITLLMPIIGILGGILGFAGILLSTLTETPTQTILLFEGLALICLTAYFISNWHRLKTFSARRSTRLGFNTLLAIALLIGILGIINFLAIRHGGRWDLSETQNFTLAPQTYQVLGRLNQDVHVTLFSHERSPGFGAYRDLLEGYTHASPRFTVQIVDPEKHPHIAREFAITKLDTAVFQSQTQTIHVTKPSETHLTNALIRVTIDTKKRILFLDNHGERRIDNQEGAGLSSLRDSLVNQGYVVNRAPLGPLDNLIDQTTLIVLAGPQEPLSSTERDQLSQFVSMGGRLLILIDPQTAHGLDELIAQWGLAFTPGIIVDPTDRMAQGSPTALLVRRFTEHAITHGFTAPILFPVSRPIVYVTKSGVGGTFTPLAETSEDSWAEMNFVQHTPVFDEGMDQKGPFTIAGALKLKTEPSNPASHASNLVIIGNSAFVSNAYIKLPGNTDFILNSIAWLADENALVAITPKDYSFQPFIPNPTQEHMLLAVQVFSVPLLLLFLGITVWRRRSRL